MIKGKPQLPHCSALWSWAYRPLLPFLLAPVFPGHSISVLLVFSAIRRIVGARSFCKADSLWLSGLRSGVPSHRSLAWVPFSSSLLLLTLLPYVMVAFISSSEMCAVWEQECYGLNLKQSRRLMSLTLGLQPACVAVLGPFWRSRLNQNGPPWADLWRLCLSLYIACILYFLSAELWTACFSLSCCHEPNQAFLLWGTETFQTVSQGKSCCFYQVFCPSAEEVTNVTGMCVLFSIISAEHRYWM